MLSLRRLKSLPQPLLTLFTSTGRTGAKLIETIDLQINLSKLKIFAQTLCKIPKNILRMTSADLANRERVESTDSLGRIQAGHHKYRPAPKGFIVTHTNTFLLVSP